MAVSSCIYSWNKPRKDGYVLIKRDGHSQFHHRRVLDLFTDEQDAAAAYCEAYKELVHV